MGQTLLIGVTGQLLIRSLRCGWLVEEVLRQRGAYFRGEGGNSAKNPPIALALCIGPRNPFEGITVEWNIVTSESQVVGRATD